MFYLQSRLSVSGRSSTGAAARVAGCHPVTVWRAMERGELAAVRLGAHGHYRVKPDELEAWPQPTERSSES